MKSLLNKEKISILVGILIVLMVGALLLEPLPVDPNYHKFAARRSIWGIPNFSDVVSNLPFGIFGLMGLWLVFGSSGRTIFETRYHAVPYVIFFGAVSAITIGSSYYHWAPANGPLFWDRVPIAIAFMGLFAAFLADRIGQKMGVFCFMPSLIVFASGSLLWDLSHIGQGGDLRFYALVQIYPIITLPLLCWLFPKSHYTTTKHMLLMVGWYVLAKILEVLDHSIYALLGGVVSGHSLKHLVASMAVFTVILMLKSRIGRRN
ncbi:MAG: alkaline phytoceramidase [Rhodospirillaceae bacterium]|nr:alkaline phytoceramidase [Rhodospirillaceae bacterium]|tara:strand:- start:272 stop:1057 length:786 start_codon:yes stop_codon:yes gene_type:complete